MDNCRNSMSERILALVLAVIMVFSILPAGSLEVRAAETYEVSVVKNEHGTVLIDGENETSVFVEENSSVTLTVTPDTGYKIDTIQIGDDEAFTPEDPSVYSVKLTITKNTTITVAFVEKTAFSITRKNDGWAKNATVYVKENAGAEEFYSSTGGWTEVKKDSSVPFYEGAKIRVYMKPVNENPIVTGASVVSDGTTSIVEDIHFRNADAWFDLVVDGDKSIRPTVVKRRTITAKYTEHAEITLKRGDMAVQATSADALLYAGQGDVITVIVTAKDGYNLDQVSISKYQGNITLSTENSATYYECTFTVSDGNSTVTAVLEQVYSIKLNEFQNGTVSFVYIDEKDEEHTEEIGSEGSFTVKEAWMNETANPRLVFTPASGYAVADLSGVGDANALSGNMDTEAVTVNLTKDLFTDRILNVEVAFKQLCTLTVAEVPHGDVKVTYKGKEYKEKDKFTVLAGDEVDVSVTPDDGYRASEVKLGDNNVEVEIDGNAFKLTVTESATLTVGFSEIASLSNITFYRGSEKEDAFGPASAYSTDSRIVYVFKPLGEGESLTMNAHYVIEHWYDSGYDVYDVPAFYNYYKEWYESYNYYTATSNYYKITQSIRIDKINYRHDENHWAWDSVSGIPTDGVIVAFDTEAPQITTSFDQYSGVFSSDQEIKFTVAEPAGSYKALDGTTKTDAELCSGLGEIYYTVEVNGGAPSDPIPVATYGKDTKVKTADLSFTLGAATYNGKTVKVTVVAKDRAGNVSSEQTFTLSFNTNVGLTFVEHNEDNMYPDGRTAIITVRISEETLYDSSIKINGKAVTDGIEITQFYEDLTGWRAGEIGDGVATYIKTIRFLDANYTLESITYTPSQEGAESETTNITDGVFTVDTTPPSGGKIRASWGTGEDEAVTWDVDHSTPNPVVINKDVTVTAVDTYDATSGVEKEEFYISDHVLDEDELETVEWANSAVLKDNGRFIVYLKITDYAGHSAYRYTDPITVAKENVAYVPHLTLSESYTTESGKPIYGINNTVEGTVEIALQPENLAGIKTAEYWFVKDGVADETHKLLTLSEQDGKLIGKITVNKSAYNSCNVELFVRITDNAGNVKTDSKQMDIDNVKPAFTVVETKDGAGNVTGLEITFTERKHHFEENVAKDAITITATISGKPVNNAYHFKKDGGKYWTTTDDPENPDACTHKIYVLYDQNASFDISIDYTDRAGNNNKYNGSFGFDNKAPEGDIKVDNVSVLDSLLEVLTFGLWKGSDIVATVTATDELSNVKSVSYYVQVFEAGQDERLTEDELKSLYAGGEFTEIFDSETGEIAQIPVAVNTRFVIYVRLEDDATTKDEGVGNVCYISTVGIITDNKPCDITLGVPLPSGGDETTGGANTVYNMDDLKDGLKVGVTVKDEEPYSGIKSIRYWITKDGEKLEEGTKFTFDKVNPTYEQLVNEYTFEIPVDTDKFNSCNVEVFVEAVDNAENLISHSIKLDLDNTKPEIKVTYDRDHVDGADDDCFTRVTAFITYTERTHHFDEEAAFKAIEIEGRNKAGEVVARKEKGSDALTGITSFGWTHNPDDEDANNDTHVLELHFDQDAIYTVNLSYTDRAGNEATVVSEAFTKDNTPPFGTITAKVGTKTIGEWSAPEDELVYTVDRCVNEPVNLTIVSDDVTSGVAKVQYRIEKDRKPLTEEAMAAFKDGWQDYADGISLTADGYYVIGVKIVDHAGNVYYLSTNVIVVDTKESDIKLEPSASHTKLGGIDVYGIADTPKVTITVTELARETYSGISKIEYWIVKDGTEETKRAVLYEFSNEAPAYEDLLSDWQETVEIDKPENNSCDVEVFVEVTDNAGNVKKNSVKLDIDNTRPTIQVEYTDTIHTEEAYKNVPTPVDGYFIARTATVTITERDHHFDENDVIFTVTGTNAKGDDLKLQKDTDYEIVGWETVTSETADECKHVATVKFLTDANYKFEINFTDLAGNNVDPDAEPDFEDTFTVDKTAPTGTITAGPFLYQEENPYRTWDDLVAELTFNLFNGASAFVSQETNDETSPILSVAYYKTNKDKAISEEDLLKMGNDSWTEWTGDSMEIQPDDRVVIYLRIVDYAGNVEIISTDGFILDNTLPKLEQEDVAPVITITPVKPGTVIYNEDVPIEVHVLDPMIPSGVEGGSYSGLRLITYQIFNLDVSTTTPTAQEELYRYKATASTQSELLQDWSGNPAFVVNAADNNSNNVKIVIYAEDNAGNSSTQELFIKIDITKPVIKVSYDNNNGDTTFADGTTDAFFNANRTATIEISERNFDPDEVVITMTNTDGPVPVLSGWRTEPGTGNGDNTKHIATLTYAADGDYTFDISCRDLADNANDGVDYNGLAPQKFTIDKTAPVINVSYEPGNSAAQNGNYFSTARTATITITEHNFETSRISVSLTATDNGAPISVPAVVGWTNNGNTHVATISYNADARYTFDISYRDKAGNQAADYPGDTFYVDQTLPEVKLEGITDQSANNSKENIGFILTATDTNMNVFEPKVTGVFYRDGEFVTETVEIGEIREIPNGKEFVVENLPEDGIYTVTCTVVDMAGNAFNQVTLFDADGNPYTADRTSADALVNFSVNREGSVYNIDDATKDLIGKYYVQHVKNDVVLVEINTDEVSQHTVTLNGKELTEGTDYTVATEGGNGKWVKYTYTIRQSLFEKEGFYNVVVSSTDKANNNTFSDVKGAEVKFVVDYTAPVVIVSGLEDEGRYQTEKQVVTLIPTDDGGALRSIEVLLVDEEGKTIATLLKKLEGEELEKALEENDGKLTFEVGEGLFQNVRIICDDWADFGDEQNIIYDATIRDVSVSTSPFMIFWANKPLRWGTIGGVGGLGLAGFLFFLLKKRKKDDEEEKKAKETK